MTDEYDEAIKFLAEFQKPTVIKASGLAAGKGVIITDTREEAQSAVRDIMQNNAFGDAGDTVVIEERLTGREVSVLAFCDGNTVKPMIMARDYKRALDGNEGLNTGGMGAIAPSPDMSPDFVDEVIRTTLQPILDGMNALGTPYKGVLYAGLMLTPNGIKVLEYNCRFGDPETQVVLPLLETDLYEIMLACINGTLDEIDIEWSDQSAATVVCASGGYPEAYEKGKVIQGVDTLTAQIVFHAGTTQRDGQLVTNGGRVLAVTALAENLDAALEKAYAGVKQIQFEDMHYRTDIGETYE